MKNRRRYHLIDQIPADLIKAKKWVEALYDKLQQMKKGKGRPPKNFEREVKEVIKIVKKRIKEYNYSILAKRKSREQQEADEEFTRKIFDESLWSSFDGFY